MLIGQYGSTFKRKQAATEAVIWLLKDVLEFDRLKAISGLINGTVFQSRSYLILHTWASPQA